MKQLQILKSIPNAETQSKNIQLEWIREQIEERGKYLISSIPNDQPVACVASNSLLASSLDGGWVRFVFGTRLFFSVMFALSVLFAFEEVFFAARGFVVISSPSSESEELATFLNISLAFS